MSFMCSICHNLLPNRPENLPEAQQHIDYTVTKCGHLFHTVCLDDWFNRQNVPVQQCPSCNSAVATADNRRVFPSGDDETEQLNAGLRNVQQMTQKIKDLENELNQTNQMLFETLDNLSKEQTQTDLLKYEIQNQETAIQSIQKEKEEVEELFKATEENYKVENANLHDKNKALETSLNEHELAMVKKKTDFEEQLEAQIKDSNRIKANLKEIIKTSRSQLSYVNQLYKASLRKDGVVFEDEYLQSKETQTESPETQNIIGRLQMYQYCISHLAHEYKVLESMTLQSAARGISNLNLSSGDHIGPGSTNGIEAAARLMTSATGTPSSPFDFLAHE